MYFHKRQRYASWIAALLNVFVSGFFYSFAIFASDIKLTQSYDQHQINLVGAMTYLGAFALQIPVGMILDRVGARSSTLLGISIYAVAQFMIFCFMWRHVDYRVMAMAYFLLGFGTYTIYPGTLAILYSWFDVSSHIIANIIVLVTHSLSSLIITVIYWAMVASESDRAEIESKMYWLQCALFVVSFASCIFSCVFLFPNFDECHTPLLSLRDDDERVGFRHARASRSGSLSGTDGASTTPTRADHVNYAVPELLIDAEPAPGASGDLFTVARSPEQRRPSVSENTVIPGTSWYMNEYNQTTYINHELGHYMRGVGELFLNKRIWLLGATAFCVHGVSVNYYENIEFIAQSLGRSHRGMLFYAILFEVGQFLGRIVAGAFYVMHNATRNDILVGLTQNVVLTIVAVMSFLWPRVEALAVYILLDGFVYGSFYLTFVNYCRTDVRVNRLLPEKYSFGQVWGVLALIMSTGPLTFDLVAGHLYDRQIIHPLSPPGGDTDDGTCYGSICYEQYFVFSGSVTLICALINCLMYYMMKPIAALVMDKWEDRV